MASLKSFLPKIAPVFGVTADALYERQRVLVRLGLLKPVAGRGPGSGVELSADAVAVLFISIGAAGNLSDVDGRIEKYCDAEVKTDSRPKRCPFTSERKLRGAISKLLGDSQLADQISMITFWYARPLVLLEYKAAGHATQVFFETRTQQVADWHYVSSHFKKEAVSAVSKLLATELSK